MLLEAGANPLAKNKWGDSPLSFMEERATQKNDAVVALLRAATVPFAPKSQLCTPENLYDGKPGQRATFSLQLHSVFAPIRGGGPFPVSLSVECDGEKLEDVEDVKDCGDGSYAMAFTPQKAGLFTIAVTVGATDHVRGEHVRG